LVIATAAKHLWECSGSTTGWFADSFRSKGIGQLTLLVFLEAFFECRQLHDIPVPPPLPLDPWTHIATNNEGSIDRINSGLAAKVAFAGAALSSKRDVANEIVEIARRLPIPLAWERVKGHQEERRKWCELTRMETLKVRADKFVTTGLAANLQPTRNVKMIPSSQIALRIGGTDVTSHRATHLRKAATPPRMLKHCLKRHGWSSE
jgi:hypothetical protein